VGFTEDNEGNEEDGKFMTKLPLNDFDPTHSGLPGINGSIPRVATQRQWSVATLGWYDLHPFRMKFGRELAFQGRGKMDHVRLLKAKTGETKAQKDF